MGEDREPVRKTVLLALVFSAAPLAAQAPNAPPVYAPPPIVVAPSRPVPPSPGIDPIRIYFDWDSSRLTPEGVRIVDLAARLIQACPGARVTISGHSDQSRKRAYALGLSQRMADSVRDALVSRGVDPKHILVMAMGSSRPAVAPPRSGREPRNRRVEIGVDCPGTP